MPIRFAKSEWPKFKNPVYFETGLYKGESLRLAVDSKQFKKCVSLEISKTHVKAGKKRFISLINAKRVELIHGNSKDLHQHIEAIQSPITFFLDAHDDQRIDDRKKQLHDDPDIQCPLLHELEAIARHAYADEHIILIDDMRCFKSDFTHAIHNWWEGITYQQVVKKVKELFPNHSVYAMDSYTEGDILVATPNQPCIPKKIHQTYKDAESLPELYQRCQARIKQHYMDFEYCFYSDEDMEAFMTPSFPDFKAQLYDHLPDKIMKIDVFRYCLIEEYGGMYADMDYEFIKRFDFSLPTSGERDVARPKDVGQSRDVLFLPLNRNPDEVKEKQTLRVQRRGRVPKKKDFPYKFSVGNCVFASTAKHPFWQLVRERLIALLPEIQSVYKNGKYQKSVLTYKKFILEHTGPGFLSKCLDDFLKTTENKATIETIDRYVFHPPKSELSIELGGNKETPMKDMIVGFHHCSETWLKK
jgi:mannosyltransferase OCH1-like enzyme